MKRFIFSILIVLFCAAFSWAGPNVNSGGGSSSSSGGGWSESKVILLPATTDDYDIRYFKTAAVLTYMQATCEGGTSVSIALQVCDADGVSNCSDLVSDATVTCGTAKDFTIAASAIGADKTIRLLTGTVTGATKYRATAGGTQ